MNVKVRGGLKKFKYIFIKNRGKNINRIMYIYYYNLVFIIIDS